MLSLVTPSNSLALCAIAIVLLLISKLLKQRGAAAHKLPLPPGPPPLPIVGNLLQLPSEQPWKAYDSLIQKYGDVVYLNVLGQPIVLLGSMEAVSDLLEKRSNKYSSRLHLTMLTEL